MQETLLPLKPGKSSRIKIKVINTTNHNIILPDRTPHGRLQLVQSVTQVEVKLRKRLKAHLVQAPVGSSATGRGIIGMWFFMATGVGNKKK